MAACTAISAFAPSIFAKSIFAPRRANKSVQAEDAPVSIMNGCVATAQLAKMGEGIIGIAHDSKGSLAAKIVNIDNALKEVPTSTGKLARFGMEHINGMIGATAAIKALCADDKESAAIQEGTAVVGMLAGEKAHKAVFGSSTSKCIDGVNQIEVKEGFLCKEVPLYAKTVDKIVEKCNKEADILAECGGVKKTLGKAIKYAPSVVKGGTFALTSILCFAGAHSLGGELAEVVTGREVA
jgi:hypothetical protein